MRRQVQDYYRRHGIPPERATRADEVLALLRINTPQALARAEELVGKPIERCPSAVPPWPPKPVGKAPGDPRILRVDFPPGQHQIVRIGMTRQQLLSRGVTRQNILKWTKVGRIQWSK